MSKPAQKVSRANLRALKVLGCKRTPIPYGPDGDCVRFNAFYSVDGTWNRRYLRVCTVYRLFDRGRIDRDRAAELLKGFVPRGIELAVVNQWRARP